MYETNLWLSNMTEKEFLFSNHEEKWVSSPEAKRTIWSDGWFHVLMFFLWSWFMGAFVQNALVP